MRLSFGSWRRCGRISKLHTRCVHYYLLQTPGIYRLKQRIIDMAPSFIDLKYVKAIGKEVQDFLVQKMEIGTVKGAEICAAYLAEDPSIKSRREELVAQEQRLLDIQKKLHAFYTAA
jgi:hypothetical protein